MIRFALVSSLLLLPACDKGEDTTASGNAAVDAAMQDEEPVAEEVAEPATFDPPTQFVRTAWKSVGDEGARYVTYLDADGRYRDLRNGDPYQEGAWELGDDGRLCFAPDPEEADGDCWQAQSMNAEGELVMMNDAQRRILLERMTYRPPVAAGER